MWKERKLQQCGKHTGQEAAPAQSRERRSGLVLNPSTLKARWAEGVPSSTFPKWGSRGKKGGENRQVELQEQGTVGQVQETRESDRICSA